MHARCRDEDPSLFFHSDGERGRDRRARQRAATEICAHCDVIIACREHSLRFPERFGTWGGMSEDDRNQLFGLASHNSPSTEDTLGRRYFSRSIVQ
jgi:WhiB family transcriptional regulator, redox-sensing transcriptional regulator